MKKIIALLVVIATLAFTMGTMVHTPSASAQTLTRAQAASICIDTGLTGAAAQENLLYCDTNAITLVVTNAAPSTYQQAIHLAQQKGIVVGTPTSVSQTVDWANVPITYVEFSSGLHAEHWNPSQGICRYYDAYGHQLYNGK